MRNSVEIERVKRLGSRHHTSLFTLATTASDQPGPRVGIIVGRRLGSAVVRNRAKRLFRELARQARPRLVAARDVLVFPKRRALDVSFAELRESWRAGLERAGLVPSKPRSS